MVAPRVLILQKYETRLEKKDAASTQEHKRRDNITYNTYNNCNNYIGIHTVIEYFYYKSTIYKAVFLHCWK